MTTLKSAFWNIVFALFFAAIVLKGTFLLFAWGRIPVAISPWEFLLLALAIFRLVRLFCYDIITKFIRDALAHPKPDSFLGTLHALISCSWCAGLWFSFFVVFGYYATPLAMPVILILALAGVGSFIQVLANLIGWNAEGKKREVLGAGHNSTSTCG